MKSKKAVKTERCDGCARRFPKGELRRDEMDSALLYCSQCPGNKKYLVTFECEGMVVEAKNEEEAMKKAEEFIQNASSNKILDEVKLHLEGVEDYE